MKEEEKKKVLAEIGAKEKELAGIKTKLNELNTHKEAWF